MSLHPVYDMLVRVPEVAIVTVVFSEPPPNHRRQLVDLDGFITTGGDDLVGEGGLHDFPSQPPVEGAPSVFPGDNLPDDPFLLSFQKIQKDLWSMPEA